MLIKSTALTANVTALISLLDLDVNRPITLGLSKALTSTDTFGVYATLDSATVDVVNAYQIGTISGTTPENVARGIADQAKTWSYVFLKRTGGSTAGTFYLTGDQAQTAATVQSTTAPVAGVFSAVLDLTSYAATGVRVSSSRTMTAGDKFDVYVTQDSTVTNATGCQKLGSITGGGGVNLNSLVCQGYPYAIVVPTARATVGGTLLASGTAKPVASGSGFWQQGGNGFGAIGVLGTTDAFGVSLVSGGTSFLQDDLTTTQIGRTTGASAVTINAGTGTISIGTSAAARTINIGTGAAAQTLVIGSTDTTSSLSLQAGTGNIDIGTSAAARTINIGTGAANQTINIGTGAANTVTIGSTTDPAEIRLRVSRGVGINTAGTPNSSAILELVSTTRGLLFPRMTQAERDAIGTPAAGLVIYNTDTNKLNMRAAAAWEAVTSV